MVTQFIPGARKRLEILRPVLSLILHGRCANFHEVERDRFFRSGQLTVPQLREVIHKHRIRTVLRLRGRGSTLPKAVHTITEAIAEAKINLIHLPLIAKHLPPRSQLLALCNAYETAEYPLLVQCKAGSERTGFASAAYVLWRTGNLDLALEQMRFNPYLHVCWGPNRRLRSVFEAYRSQHRQMSFLGWVRDFYRDSGCKP